MKIRTIIGIACVAVGLAITFFGGQTTTLICHHVEPDRIDCRFKYDFLGIGMGETEIPQLQSAEVQAISEGHNTCRVLLVTNSGNIPLTSGYSSGRSSKQETVDRINAFINNPRQPSFELKQRGLFGLIFGSCLSLIGFYILLRKGPLIPDWLNRLLGRKMLGLESLLDERQFEMNMFIMKGPTMSGLYHGRPVRFRYLRGGPDSGPEEFYVELSCRHGTPFKIHSRSLKKGLDKVQGLTDWVGIPGVKDTVASLVLAEHVDHLQLEDGYLGLKYSKGRIYIMGIPLGFPLGEELAPWNVALVLLKLETLVKSLESTMRVEMSHERYSLK